jgi:hypothetical protein
MSTSNTANSPQKADWVIVVSGILLGASPWIVQYSSAEGATWNAVATGTAIAVLGLFLFANFSEWQEWFGGLLGVWAVVAPWIAGFGGSTEATAAHVILGAAVAATTARRVMQIHRGGTVSTA